jgi:hypothetical protein
MTLGLGASTFVVFESLFNRNVGVVAGITFAAVAIYFFMCSASFSGSDIRVRCLFQKNQRC